MSLVKDLKGLAFAAGLEFKKNASEARMKELLDVAGVDYSLLENPEPTEPSPMAPKKGREADESAAINGKKEDKFFLGNCVKTGKPLYKILK